MPGRGARHRLPGTADGVTQPYEAPFDGKIVAWSITLARPSQQRVRKRPATRSASSTTSSAGPGGADRSPSPGRGSNPPKFTLARQSPLQVLNPYFGRKVIFALEHPLTILRGHVVALTVPTWAPMFAFNVSGENNWRGSRKPDHCSSQRRHPGRPSPSGRHKTKTYGCYYSSARLLYTATLVKKP